MFNAGNLEEGRGKINEAHIIIHHPTRLGDALGPHDGQWQVVGIVVSVSFAMRKRHAVVGSHHHDCVLEQSALFQVCQHAAQMQIEIFHLQRVIEHVVADFLGIWPTCGHAIDIGGLLAALGHAGSIFVSAMRLVAAIPE